jgi:uncharacterized protein YkwD/uncharacterized protein YukE
MPGTGSGSYVPGQNATTSATDLKDNTISQQPIVSLPNLQSNIKPVISNTGNEITAETSRLSISGILTETNDERTTRQLPKLRLNAQLNKAAEAKLQDMFTQQYFQHVSPAGVGVSDLIRKVGYEYIVVGENLALGNFGGDPQVVLAWMNSPGHKANIIDPRFQEIGISVGKGLYNGKTQWIAVQQFAKPLSSCTSPNPELKDKIAQHTSSLSSLETEITTMKANIDRMQSSDPTYTSTVEQYNLKANDYNTRLEGLKDEINTYNEQVRTFNSCAGLAK